MASQSWGSLTVELLQLALYELGVQLHAFGRFFTARKGGWERLEVGVELLEAEVEQLVGCRQVLDLLLLVAQQLGLLCINV
jgi:hypothetical protein